MKPGQTSFDGLVKLLNDDYAQFKSHYNADLKLRVFTPDLIQPDSEVASTTVSEQSNDLPF